MAKIGRNKRCPCGSGKKYKYCHGRLPVGAMTVSDEGSEEWLARAKRRAEADRKQREQQQGLGRPIVSTEAAGHRLVAVGNNVFTSKRWKTFHDFLRDYLINQLGREWFASEASKPPQDRHQIVRWYGQSIAVARSGGKVGDLYSSRMTGAQRAFLNLAYNLYLIAHHANPAQLNWLLNSFIQRLKSERSDDFVGKLFETYAAAAFLKAGFELAYEDEADVARSHVEFVATYPKTGRRFSVEVKSRNRAPSEDGTVDDIKRLRVSNKLNRALAKQADHTRVVMIEVNVPDVINGTLFDGWPKAALAQIRQVEQMPAPDGGEKPSAYVIVTNHAYHNNLEAVDVGTQALAAGCRIPDFGPDVSFNRLQAVLECERRHQEMFALVDAMREHYAIPSTFNGENPELAFLPGPEEPPLRIGDWYTIPGPDGELAGQLTQALVDEHKKSVMGVYRTERGSIMVSCPLTEVEFAAWKRHPETFFGEVSKKPKQAENWIELAKFFYETYQHTSRDKLLEWMKDAADYVDICMLSQEQLAVIYCERLALAAEMKN